MKVIYVNEANELRFLTGDKGTTGASLLDDHNILIELATDDSHDIVALTIIGPSAYLPLGKKGYDAEGDVLTLGVPVDDPAMTTENGDLTAYWQVDKDDPDAFIYPVGAAVKHVSKHLAPVLADLSE